MSTAAVFENNRNWANAIKESDPDFFKRLAEGQDPDFLMISCADSRVPTGQIMGLGPENIFTHRNVANLVSHTDLNIQAVIEYAVKHLDVRHIVVCGHTGCGGVKAALTQDDLGVLNPWIRVIKDLRYVHKEELDEDARLTRLIELNVRAQCLNVAKTTSFQQATRNGNAPQIHGWVFHLDTGLLEDLDVKVTLAQQRFASIFSVDARPPST
jgi:carbonic anhydrase